MSGKIKKRASGKKINQRNEEPKYLTKRILVRGARQGIAQAASETMALIGHNVIVQKGWIVKKYADGRVVKLSPITPLKGSKTLRLD